MPTSAERTPVRSAGSTPRANNPARTRTRSLIVKAAPAMTTARRASSCGIAGPNPGGHDEKMHGQRCEPASDDDVSDLRKDGLSALAQYRHGDGGEDQV